MLLLAQHRVKDLTIFQKAALVFLFRINKDMERIERFFTILGLNEKTKAHSIWSEKSHARPITAYSVGILSTDKCLPFWLPR